MKKKTRNQLLFFSFIASVVILSGVLSLVDDAKYKKANRSTMTREELQEELDKVSLANKQTTPKPKTTSKAELAYQLAVIDSGYVSRDDPSVAVFNRLLTKLDSYFIENRLEISDATVNAQELLKKEGIEVKLKVIMEGLQGVYPYKIENQKYLDILVYYMTFRKDFQSHSEAIISLKAIIIAIIGG